MGVWNLIRKLFSSGGAEEKAAQHEEYGIPDRAHERDRTGLSSFADAESAESAEDELDEFKAPRDSAP